MPSNPIDNTATPAAGDMFLAEEPNQSPSFITNDEGGDTTSDLQVDHDGRSATALDHTSETPGPIEGNQHTLDSMVSDEDHFERTMRQSAERGSEGLNRNANLRLCITGEFFWPIKAPYFEDRNRQTSKFNVQRKGPTFHPSTQSNSSFLDLESRKGRFYCWKRTLHRHGSSRCLLNCKDSIANNFTFGFYNNVAFVSDRMWPVLQLWLHLKN